MNQKETDDVIDSDVIDIDKWLPFSSTDKIETFCSDDDGLLSKRKLALLKKIKAAGDSSCLRNFVSTITNALFSRQFVIEHKWPVKE